MKFLRCNPDRLVVSRKAASLRFWLWRSLRVRSIRFWQGFWLSFLFSFPGKQVWLPGECDFFLLNLLIPFHTNFSKISLFAFRQGFFRCLIFFLCFRGRIIFCSFRTFSYKVSGR